MRSGLPHGTRPSKLVSLTQPSGRLCEGTTLSFEVLTYGQTVTKTKKKHEKRPVSWRKA